MQEILKDKKNIISVLMLLILILAIPLGLGLIKKQQILRSRAVEGGVSFSGPNVTTRDSKTFLKQTINEEGQVEAKVDLIITSPLGPPGSGEPGSTGSSDSGGSEGSGGGASATVE